ncbi:MAG: phytase [Calditrichia bacterium]
MSLYIKLLFAVLTLLLSFSCAEQKPSTVQEQPVESSPLQPIYVTDSVPSDSDDPAVWINHDNPANSLILGTDKGDSDVGIAGGLYVFNLKGEVQSDKCIRNLERPNNVDVEYGFNLNGTLVDIAVVTLRGADKIRIFRLPEMEPLDNGGIPVFATEAPEQRKPMGISMYKRPSDGAVFAVLSRKNGPPGRYLWQYLLNAESDNSISIKKVREFGDYSGGDGEVEAIVVDDKPGYIYYSDELKGVRKYHADPAHPDASKELALFATSDFASDREGLSIYELNDEAGYILVSDQQANKFRIFPREGTADNPHEHKLLKVVDVMTQESDGSETISLPLGPDFPNGLFIAMSETKNFYIYSWETIAGGELLLRSDTN